MKRSPPRFQRPNTRVPYTTRFRSWLAIWSRRRDDDDYETGYSAGYSSGYRAGTDHDEHKEGMTDRLKRRASAAGESLRERASDLGERAGELGHEARRRARHYGRSGGRYVKDHQIGRAHV